MASRNALLLAAVLFINGYFCQNEVTSCKINDDLCADKLVKEATDVLYTGQPSLGVEAIDPLYFDFVEANLTIVNYKLFKSTLTGYKDCKFLNIKTNISAMKLNLGLECPGYNQMNGKFEIDGVMYNRGRISGKGDYDFSLGPFKVDLDANLAKLPSGEGLSYLKIKSFLSKATVKTPFKATFKNLISIDNTKFTPENFKAVGDLLQEPLLFASFKKILSNVNLYLKSKPFEN